MGHSACIKNIKHQFRFGGYGTRLAHQHPNGGGWVEHSASVSKDCYINKRAEIQGCAQLHDGVSVLGNVLISDEAEVYDRVEVASPDGEIRIGGRAKIHDGVTIRDNVRVCGDVEVSGDFKNSGNLWLQGNVNLFGKFCLTKEQNILTIASIGKFRNLTFIRDDSNWINPKYFLICGRYSEGGVTSSIKAAIENVEQHQSIERKKTFYLAMDLAAKYFGWKSLSYFCKAMMKEDQGELITRDTYV